MSRVAFLLHGLHGGGAERVVLRLAGELSQRGHVVEVLVAGPGGELEHEVPHGVRLRVLGTGRTRSSLRPLVRLLRDDPPDVVVTALAEATLSGLAARALAGAARRRLVRAAVVATVHNHPRAELAGTSSLKDRLLMRAAIRSYPHADAVVCVSQGVADDLGSATGGRVRADVIHNPVVDAELLEQARRPPPHPWLEGGDPVVLAVGRLTAQKDVATLLRAVAVLEGRRPVRLVVLGDGPERPALEAQTRTLGMADRVLFAGFDGERGAWMAHADVLASSSRWEGFGNVLAEALAVGTPVVATRCPSGPEEILDGGRYGELVPVGDARALADAIERTLDRPVDRAALAVRGRSFSVEAATDHYDTLLSRVVAGRRSEPPLRVLQLGPALDSRGGMATVQAAILAHPPDGCAVRHAATWRDGPVRSWLGLFARAVVLAATMTAARKVDVVHLHMAEKGSVLRKAILVVLCRVTGTPVVVHAHGARFAPGFDRLPRSVRRTVARVLRSADRFVALSAGEAASYTERLGLVPGRVVVLPNPVPEIDGGLHRSERPYRTVAFVGRIGERKGAFELVEAFAALPVTTRSRTRLVLVGDGDVAAARALADRLGIGEHLETTGWVDGVRLADVYRTADLVALPSHDEALPMTLLEAVAWGVPVVTTPVGSIPDHFVDGESCLLVPPGDVPALTAALERLLSDPDLARRLVDGAAPLRERFGPRRYRSALGEIYRQAAQRGRRPTSSGSPS